MKTLKENGFIGYGVFVSVTIILMLCSAPAWSDSDPKQDATSSVSKTSDVSDDGDSLLIPKGVRRGGGGFRAPRARVAPRRVSRPSYSARRVSRPASRPHYSSRRPSRPVATHTRPTVRTRPAPTHPTPSVRTRPAPIHPTISPTVSRPPASVSPTTRRPTSEFGATEHKPTPWTSSTDRRPPAAVSSTEHKPTPWVSSTSHRPPAVVGSAEHKPPHWVSSTEHKHSHTSERKPHHWVRSTEHKHGHTGERKPHEGHKPPHWGAATIASLTGSEFSPPDPDVDPDIDPDPDPDVDVEPEPEPVPVPTVTRTPVETPAPPADPCARIRLEYASSDPGDLNQKGMAEFENNNFRTALCWFELALKRLETAGRTEEPLTVNVLENLAKTYQALGKEDEAASVSHRVSILRERLKM